VKKFAGYEPEQLHEYVDDGTMPNSRYMLESAIVGHRIVKAEIVESPNEYGYTFYNDRYFELTLDNGTRVRLANTADCCASTELKSFLLHPDKIDHIITGVGTTDGYNTWHIYADFGDVLEMDVEWSAGNTGYYVYGFTVKVMGVHGG
jgi:hypothetical protein